MNMLPVFSQAVDELFPELDEETKDAIKQRVMIHMFEKLKEEVFAGDQGELENLQDSIEATTDPQEKIKLHSKFLEKKYNELPTDKKMEIDQKQNNELTQVMHHIYQSCKKND